MARELLERSLPKFRALTRLFVLSQSDDFAQFNAYHFRNEASRLGIPVVGNMLVDETENLGWLVDNITTAEADLVYFSTLSVDQAGTLFKEARMAGYMGAFLGPDTIDSPYLMKYAGPDALKGGGIYYSSITVPTINYPEAALFIQDFESA